MRFVSPAAAATARSQSSQSSQSPLSALKSVFFTAEGFVAVGTNITVTTTTAATTSTSALLPPVVTTLDVRALRVAVGDALRGPDG